MADTVHSAFKYPVLTTDSSEINWDLSVFDLVVIDEISLLPKRIVDHVIDTINQLPIRPVVIMCGDKQQQQPINRMHNNQVISIFQHGPFFSMVHHFKLTVQHRCEDAEFRKSSTMSVITNHLNICLTSFLTIELS